MGIKRPVRPQREEFMRSLLVRYTEITGTLAVTGEFKAHQLCFIEEDIYHKAHAR